MSFVRKEIGIVERNSMLPKDSHNKNKLPHESSQ
jgi:hypothetical protein